MNRSTYLFILLSLLLFSCKDNKNIYVSPRGDDNNNGSIKHPFATLQHAIDLIRDNGHNNSVIYLREGVYDQTKTIVLDSMPANLVIKACPGEKVLVTGGKRISGFNPVKKGTAVYVKLNSNIRDKILQVDLKKLGITDYGEIKPRGFGRPIMPSGLMLYFNGEPMTIARWPNTGWVRTKDIPEETEGKGFRYSGNRPDRWKGAKDIWMHGYWKWDWADSYQKVETISLKKKEVVFADPQSPYPYTKGRRYYVFNLLEELDSPGEWYLDRESGMLYFYPPSDIENAEIYVSLMTEPLIRIENSKGITIEGLTLEYSNGAGVELINGSENVIYNCVLKNFGTVAATIGRMNAGSKIYDKMNYTGDAGENNGISGYTIFNCGEGGIILGGGNRKTLTPGNNFVENTKIYKVSEWVRTYRAGIYMYGVGNIVRHNEISDLPHTAIFFGCTTKPTIFIKNGVTN